MFKKVPLQGSDRIKIAIALGLLLGLVAIQPATAESIGSNPTGLYVGAARGLDFYKDDDDFDFEGGASLSLQLGYRFSDNWRAELDSSVTAVGLDDTGDDDDILGIVRGTLSLYYDFQSSDNLLVPYAGAGPSLTRLGTFGADIAFSK